MIVGLCSSYLEGPLVQAAVRSLLAACDRVVVFEGPAGTPLDEDVPPSDLSRCIDAEPNVPTLLPFEVKHGTWKTDAAKRTAMIEEIRPLIRSHEGSTWGVWVDGDEVLVNGEYLRDWLQYFDWVEEETGRENMGWPIKLVELDGSIAVAEAKVVRVDRLDSYSVSSSLFRNTLGALESHGNYRASVADFPLGAQLRGLGDPDGGYLFAWPPLPCEPFIMHRSKLRHPRRTGLRLHEQEAVEIEKLKADVGA